jgi:hypothetical protein
MMKEIDTWKLVESKIDELRLLTDEKWKNSEWELAALGERVIRTVEQSKAESECLRANAQALQDSLKELIQQVQYRDVFQTQNPDDDDL